MVVAGGTMLTLKIVKPDDAMDWMTFVSSLVGSIAWPVAAFAIAFLFRSQIRKLLDRLRKLSLGENSVDFAEQLDDAEVIAEQAVVDVPPAEPGPVAEDEQKLKMLKLSPSVVVLNEFRAVERKVNKMARTLYADDSSEPFGRKLSFRTSVRLLKQHGQISEATANLLGELFVLRNSAAHTEEISTSEAVRFLQLVNEAHRALAYPA